MKKILSIAFALMLALGANAQLDRSKRPEPGPAPKLDFGKYKLYELKNGLKIIVVEDHKLPRLSMNLIVDRDPIQEGDKAGFVSLAGEMLRQGTGNLSKSQLDEEIDFIGASLNTGSASIYTSGLSKYAEKLFSLTADVALNPSFPEEEFEKLKKQTISGLESQKDDPSAVSTNAFNAVLYGKDHPYGEMTTVSTVEKVSLEDCKTYYKNYWVPNNTYIAVVGDIKAKDAKKLIQKYFGEWEMGNVAENVYEKPAEPASTQVSFVNKSSAVQSVVALGNIIELKPGDEDVIKLQLANQILGGGSLGRLFQNIREDKGYTYGAYSSYDDDELIGEFGAEASVRNEVTDSAIVEFLAEFKKLQTEPVSEEELEGAKNYIIGSFGRSLESPQTVARFALNVQRYNLDEDYYKDYLTKLQALTAQDVMDAANKYIKTNGMHIVVVGKGTEVAPKLEQFGTITYYDEEGNVTGPPSTPIPAGLTADSVVNMYIKALGGKENLNKVKDVAIYYDATIAGAPMKINAVSMKKRPNKFKMEISAEGMGTLNKTIFDGKKASMSGMQGAQDIEGEELEEIKKQGEFYPELNYLSDQYTLKLTHMDKIGDEEVYVMEVTNQDGKKTSEYYSAATGLKLKEESTEEGPQGPMTVSQSYGDYKEVKGVKFPYSMTLEQGQQIKFTATEIKVNSGLKDSEFTK